MKLVNTLLDFSRIEAGRLQASYEPSICPRFTAELASVFRAAIERGGLTLTVDARRSRNRCTSIGHVGEDRPQPALQAFIKHTFEGGIRVSLSWCADHAELAVKDSGVGIPEAEFAARV